MKHLTIKSPTKGKISRIFVKKGDLVDYKSVVGFIIAIFGLKLKLRQKWKVK